MGISITNRTQGSVNVLTTRKWFLPLPSSFAHDKEWDLHPGRRHNMCTFGSWTTVYVWPHTGRDSYPSDIQLGFMNAIKVAIRASLWMFFDMDGVLESLFGDFVMDWLLERAIEVQLTGEVQAMLEQIRDALNLWRANNRPPLNISKCEVHATAGWGLLDRVVNVEEVNGRIMPQKGYIFEWRLVP